MGDILGGEDVADEDLFNIFRLDSGTLNGSLWEVSRSG